MEPLPPRTGHQALPHPRRHRPRRRAQGRAASDIIGLGAGEPDFDTPQHIKDAAIKAINAGFTKYTAGRRHAQPEGGDHRQVPAATTASTTRPKQILVSCGGKQSFFNLVQAVINPGDEVIIPAPYWVSYPDIVLLADGKPVIVEAGIEQGFKITPAQLEAAITPKTRHGGDQQPQSTRPARSTRGDELAALGEVLRKHPQVLIATDDMYEHIRLNDAPFVNILNACPDLYDAHPGAERRVEGLFDDRLAHRLCGGTGRHHRAR